MRLCKSDKWKARVEHNLLPWALQGLDLWIVDALRYQPHPSHFHVELTLAWIERLGPRRAILTNMHTDLDFEELRAKLPANVEPAYDGMRVEVEG